MSFSPRNVSTLAVGTTSKADAAIYAAASGVGDYLITAIPDADAASGDLTNKGAKIMVRTVGGHKVPDTVITANISSIKSGVLAAGTLKQVTAQYAAVSDFADKTFVITIDKHDHIGSMLNDRYLSAYVTCDADGNFMKGDGTVVAASLITVTNELAALMTSTILINKEDFTVVGNGIDTLTITETAASQVVGVKDGVSLPWEIIAGVKNSEFEQIIPATQVVVVAPKVDDLVQMKNIEWFNSGYDKDPYRETGYPYSFQADSNLVATGTAIGDAYCIIQFYKDRDATNIERQHRQLIIVGAAATAFKAALDATVV